MRELLDNAIVSIELGVEDLEIDDKRRLQSAIRNVYAGVLLLCKQVLWNASPAGTDGSLIYKELVPEKQGDGTVLMKPKNLHRSTVDRRMIEERFRALGLELDWDRLTKLANIRNDVEHLFMKATATVAREALAASLPLIEKLVVDHLGHDLEEVLSEEARQFLLENSEVFEAQRARCIASFEKVDWGSDTLAEAVSDLRCDDCGSTLVRQGIADNDHKEKVALECVECGTLCNYEDAIEAALKESNHRAAYIVMKDGGHLPVENCPECGRESWIMEDAACAFCGELDLTCGICSTECSPEQFVSEQGLCSSCFWTMQKALRD